MGEVVALLGDNGAGKSTLIKCLSGALRLDRGTIEMDGVPVSIHTPADARALGIETVYQDLALFDNLRPSDNFYAGRELAGPHWLPRSIRVLKRREMATTTKSTLERMNVTLDDHGVGRADVGRSAPGGRRQPRGRLCIPRRDPRRADRGPRCPRVAEKCSTSFSGSETSRRLS